MPNPAVKRTTKSSAFVVRLLPRWASPDGNAYVLGYEDYH